MFSEVMPYLAIAITCTLLLWVCRGIAVAAYGNFLVKELQKKVRSLEAKIARMQGDDEENQ